MLEVLATLSYETVLHAVCQRKLHRRANGTLDSPIPYSSLRILNRHSHLSRVPNEGRKVEKFSPCRSVSRTWILTLELLPVSLLCHWPPPPPHWLLPWRKAWVIYPISNIPSSMSLGILVPTLFIWEQSAFLFLWKDREIKLPVFALPWVSLVPLSYLFLKSFASLLNWCLGSSALFSVPARILDPKWDS